jgi:hypothetical protein
LRGLGHFSIQKTTTLTTARLIVARLRAGASAFVSDPASHLQPVEQHALGFLLAVFDFDQARNEMSARSRPALCHL